MKYYRLILDPKVMAKALMVSERAIMKNFVDGRVASRWTEEWSSKLYQFETTGNNDVLDGVINHPIFGRSKIAVRTLTKAGVKFQQSKHIGSGRTCSHDDMIDSISSVDWFIVADIRYFPEIKFIPVPSANLLKYSIKKNGLTADKFYSLFVPLGVNWENFTRPIDLAV